MSPFFRLLFIGVIEIISWWWKLVVLPMLSPFRCTSKGNFVSAHLLYIPLCVECLLWSLWVRLMSKFLDLFQFIFTANRWWFLCVLFVLLLITLFDEISFWFLPHLKHTYLPLLIFFMSLCFLHWRLWVMLIVTLCV